MSEAHITLSVDSSLLQKMIGRLEKESRSFPHDVFERLADRLENLANVASFQRIDSSAVRAGHFLYILEPSESFLELYAAAVTRNFDFFRVEVQFHGGSF